LRRNKIQAWTQENRSSIGCASPVHYQHQNCAIKEERHLDIPITCDLRRWSSLPDSVRRTQTSNARDQTSSIKHQALVWHEPGVFDRQPSSSISRRIVDGSRKKITMLELVGSLSFSPGRVFVGSKVSDVFIWPTSRLWQHSSHQAQTVSSPNTECRLSSLAMPIVSLPFPSEEIASYSFFLTPPFVRSLTLSMLTRYIQIPWHHDFHGRPYSNLFLHRSLYAMG